MRQRGKKSPEAIAAIDISAVRLATPAGLTRKERAEFERLINATDPRHFRQGDTPLMIAFVQASILSRRLARDVTKNQEWERATRVLASLATKLRLSPQSRFDRKTIGSMERPPDETVPWNRKTQSRDDDDDADHALQ